jgi:hypothetical protein
MADTTNRLAGTASITVDGVSYPLRGNFKYRPATINRETVTGQDNVHGYKEMPQPGMISCDITDAGNLTVAFFNAMTNVTVVASLANGKTIVGSAMWTVGEGQEVETVDAKFSVTWDGRSVTEA